MTWNELSDNILRCEGGHKLIALTFSRDLSPLAAIANWNASGVLRMLAVAAVEFGMFSSLCECVSYNVGLSPRCADQFMETL